MKLLLFTVFDSAAHRYLEPFTASTVEVALRMFRHTVNSGKGPFSQFPEDYSLFCVGEFDQEKGQLRPYQELQSLGVAITFVEMRNPTNGQVARASVMDGEVLERPDVHIEEVLDA